MIRTPAAAPPRPQPAPWRQGRPAVACSSGRHGQAHRRRVVAPAVALLDHPVPPAAPRRSPGPPPATTNRPPTTSATTTTAATTSHGPAGNAPTSHRPPSVPGGSGRTEPAARFGRLRRVRGSDEPGRALGPGSREPSRGEVAPMRRRHHRRPRVVPALRPACWRRRAADRWTCPGWKARPGSTGTRTGSPHPGRVAPRPVLPPGVGPRPGRAVPDGIAPPQADGNPAAAAHRRAAEDHRAAPGGRPVAARLSADAQAVLAAYADGVTPGWPGNPLPPEYGAQPDSVRPWRALDSVAVGKLQSFGLSFDLDTEHQPPCSVPAAGRRPASTAPPCFPGTVAFGAVHDASTVPTPPGRRRPRPPPRPGGQPRPPGRPASAWRPRAADGRALAALAAQVPCCARRCPVTGAAPAPTSGRCRAGWPRAATRCWPTTPPGPGRAADQAGGQVEPARMPPEIGLTARPRPSVRLNCASSSAARPGRRRRATGRARRAISRRFSMPVRLSSTAA